MNEDMVMALRRRQAAQDQVRVAYGAVSVILEGFPESDPVRVKIRDRARAMLVEQGYLTVEEVDTLPVKDAITAVLKRLRGEASRAGLVRVSATWSARRSAQSAVS
ncbi:MAG: hypothetical protein ACRDJC_14115 [Thermomicrobiales bacterium]